MYMIGGRRRALGPSETKTNKINVKQKSILTLLNAIDALTSNSAASKKKRGFQARCLAAKQIARASLLAAAGNSPHVLRSRGPRSRFVSGEVAKWYRATLLDKFSVTFGVSSRSPLGTWLSLSSSVRPLFP